MTRHYPRQSIPHQSIPPQTIPHQSIEVGGPGGIQISAIPAGLESTPPNNSIGEAIALATRHPRAAGTALGLVSASLLAGPLVVILALELPSWLVIVPVILAAAAAAAALAVSRGALLRLDRARRRPELERRLLDLAAHVGGRLTVPVAAHRLSLPLQEAEDTLTSLARDGHVEIDNDPETGELVYLFRILDTDLPHH